MTEKLGTIYLITNKLNGIQYVGQTARDMWTRFEEHCNEKRPGGLLHDDIQLYGHQNFELKELERVPLSKLDEREKYWISYYDTYANGYNCTPGGQNCRFSQHPCIKVVENGFIIDSAAELARIMEEANKWSCGFMTKQIRKAINDKTTFLDYHFEETYDRHLTPYDEVDNWVRTLELRFVGKHIYCNELDMHFNTIADCARYLLDNNLYLGKSQMPMQSLVTAIGKQLHGRINHITSAKGNLTFDFMPGTTKQAGAPKGEQFKNKKVYCPQIDKEFESQTDAAKYFLENKIWTGIKLKTARLRISDVVNGNFPHYKNYTFERR